MALVSHAHWPLWAEFAGLVLDGLAYARAAGRTAASARDGTRAGLSKENGYRATHNHRKRMNDIEGSQGTGKNRRQQEVQGQRALVVFGSIGPR